MRLFFSFALFVLLSGTATAQEQNPSARTMPAISPQKMSVRRLEAQLRGLENALQSANVADINHYYGAVLMHLRESIQQQEAQLKEGMPVPTALEQQRAILQSFDGFEFSKTTAEMAAEKMKLLRSYADMKRAEVQ